MKAGKVFIVLCVVGIIGFPIRGSAAEVDELNARVEALEKRLALLEKSLQPLVERAKYQQLQEAQQQQARVRMRKDAENYTRDELRDIEALYQVANKKWKTKAAQESLQKLVKKYDKANRTGCAVLYLGQMSRGDQQIEHLQQAIEKFSDCYYGDGVQVGAYARFMLAQVYLQGDKPKQAEELFKEIRNDYPTAVDHRGNSLVAILPK